MFVKRVKHKRIADKERRQAIYEKVYAIHKQATFLCYINDAYIEEYAGKNSVKLEGLVARGVGSVEDSYILFDCNGKKKAEVTMEELYLGTNSVKTLEGGDKRVALYPRQQEVPYRAGDILCKLKETEQEQTVMDSQKKR